jgi:hypothetical protein
MKNVVATATVMKNSAALTDPIIFRRGIKPAHEACAWVI